MITIAVCAEKGGVGKTTVTVNLAASLARRIRVLVVDTDPQNDCKLCFGLGGKEAVGSVISVLLDGQSTSKAITVARDNIWLLESGGGYLMGAMSELQERKQNDPFRLQKALDKVAKVFDICLIDTSPSRSLLTTMAICAADWVLIPCSADDYMAAAGAISTNGMIEEARQKYGLQQARLAYVVPTFLDKRRRRSTDETLDTLKRVFQGKLSSPIRTNSRLKDCPAYGQHVYELGDRSGIDDFDVLTEEVLAVVSGQK
jgi:chromosome partitioning protein